LSLVHLSQIEFSYPGATLPTLRIPEFTVEAGERIFLFGPSGTGKSTFLEILAGVLVPQIGEVRLLGQKLHEMSPAARDQFRADHVGYVFQSFNLIPYLNVRENIELPLHISARRRSRLKLASVNVEVRRLAEGLGIGELLERSVTELSVGQQQRVAVARALIGSPEIILADEPTSALDMDHRARFLKLLFSMAKESGTTVLFVSHDRSIQDLFSRAMALEALQGKLA
jgi:putative ABC transport system ATP-binding protein